MRASPLTGRCDGSDVIQRAVPAAGRELAGARSARAV